MRSQIQTDVQQRPKQRESASFLQRKCACGGNSGLTGECEACRTGRLTGTGSRRPANSENAPADFGGPMHRFGDIDVLGDHSTPAPSRSAGRLSVRVSQTGTPRSGDEPTAEDQNQQEPQTSIGATTAGNRIDFDFDPSTSVPKPKCDEIVIIQSIQMNADGAPILPGSWYTPWKCRDAVALAGATYIDHDCPCNTPYYTYCFNGTAGSSNGVTVHATSVDAPDATGGGDKGFRSAANPTGWTNLTWSFETYAFCAGGPECGTWYDGVRWDYKKTDADNTAGRHGASTASASILPPGPGATVVKAFDKFNSGKGFHPCTQSVMPRTP
jgi:hypothetical protein